MAKANRLNVKNRPMTGINSTRTSARIATPESVPGPARRSSQNEVRMHMSAPVAPVALFAPVAGPGLEPPEHVCSPANLTRNHKRSPCAAGGPAQFHDCFFRRPAIGRSWSWSIGFR